MNKRILSSCFGSDEKIFPSIAENKTYNHGMSRLPRREGMSSRTGDVITAESLIDEVRERVIEKMKDSDIDNKGGYSGGNRCRSNKILNIKAICW